MLNRFKEFKHPWERSTSSNKDIIFRNSFKDIEYILTTCAGNNTRFEFECYDTSHLYNLKYFFDQGLVKAPLFIQTVFGLQGGIGAHPDDVMHMKRTADRLFGDNYQWSVLGAGRNQLKIAAMAAAHGRQRARGAGGQPLGRAGPSGGEQCGAGAARAADHRGMGLEIASPDEAREMLSLKGGDQVAF
jgi:uncharacterized protein (DUF849 family)